MGPEMDAETIMSRYILKALRNEGVVPGGHRDDGRSKTQEMFSNGNHKNPERTVLVITGKITEVNN